MKEEENKIEENDEKPKDNEKKRRGSIEKKIFLGKIGSSTIPIEPCRPQIKVDLTSY